MRVKDMIYGDMKLKQEQRRETEQFTEEEKKEMHFVENEQLVDILNEAYPKIRGKLNLSRLDSFVSIRFL